MYNLTEWNGVKVIKQEGLYFWVEGDYRKHFDGKKAHELYMSIPNYWEDTCPVCGNKENIGGCRCHISHRTCPKCGTQWYWALDRMKVLMYTIITNKGETK